MGNHNCGLLQLSCANYIQWSNKYSDINLSQINLSFENDQTGKDASKSCTKG